MLEFVQAWYDRMYTTKCRLHFTVEATEDAEWENPMPDFPEQRRITFVAIAKIGPKIVSTSCLHPYGVLWSSHTFTRFINYPIEGEVQLKIGKVTGTRVERVLKRREGKLDETWDEIEVET